MLISRHTPLNVIDIKAPKYSTRELLIGKYRVRQLNKIVIKEGAYKGEYFMDGNKIAKYPIGTNGKIAVYKVPLDDLEILEYKEDINRIAMEIFNG